MISKNNLRNGERRWPCNADDLMRKIDFFKERSMVEAYKEKAVKLNYLTAGN